MGHGMHAASSDAMPSVVRPGLQEMQTALVLAPAVEDHVATGHCEGAAAFGQ